ncbi:hypothetical protein NWFMUON74_40390 [Nocardia wallacei]|uniref:Uncharacterized protein n=1 Tax=Nocardia wallacei TaxID=480035 RepID=A0A7G1KLY6_9NOCA|nr:hypothetical protein NWFMUON74_40390 [Nocardia wallacei]
MKIPKRAAVTLLASGETLVVSLAALVILCPTASAENWKWFECGGRSYQWCQQSKTTLAREGNRTQAINWPDQGCTAPPESYACRKGFWYYG